MFVMATQISPDALHSTRSLELLERQAMDRVAKECPQVEWISSYATLGPYDYIDVFKAPDVETATKVAALIRVLGHSHTEVWSALPWEGFKRMLGTLSQAAEKAAA
jgi:uncharacterized protein with GYD domain